MNTYLHNQSNLIRILVKSGQEGSTHMQEDDVRTGAQPLSNESLEGKSVHTTNTSKPECVCMLSWPQPNTVETDFFNCMKDLFSP